MRLTLSADHRLVDGEMAPVSWEPSVAASRTPGAFRQEALYA